MPTNTTIVLFGGLSPPYKSEKRMADYRRWYVPGGTYFFTVVAHNRYPLFADPFARELLAAKIRECQKEWPFTINAIVSLPEHLHAMWTLPPGDAKYPMRWGWIKKEFTKAWLAAGGIEQPVSEARRKRGDRGIWQFRYWEHTIEDEDDYDRHFDYTHYNPTKHGYVTRPGDWPHSSIHRWIKAGVYPPDWGCSEHFASRFAGLDQTAMELGVD